MLVLLLFATQTWATVSIIVEEGSSSGLAKISYISDVNVSGLGLDVSADDANIISISGFNRGECVSANNDPVSSPGISDGTSMQIARTLTTRATHLPLMALIRVQKLAFSIVK